MRAMSAGLILVWMTAAPGAAPQSTDAAKPDLAAGIYAATTTGLVPMAMEMSSGSDVKGRMRPSMTFSFTGTTADLRLSVQPEFRFVVPRMKQTNDPQEMMRMATMMGMRPNQFAIFRFTTDKFDRLLDGKKAKRVELEVERLSTETYRAKPKSALEPGEYALCPAYGGQIMGQVWTFGVDR